MFPETVAATELLDQSLRPQVLETPLERRPAFDRPGIKVYAKLENTQPTGSFKFRGATAKIQSLAAGELEAGVVTASTGNHGAAVAHAAALAGTRATVHVAQDADSGKVATIRAMGAEIIMLPGDPVAAEIAARANAADTGRTYVSPYNDLVVVAGQGTIASEMCRQSDSLDAVVVSVGGGGLISGIAATLKSRTSARVIGAVAANSAAMYASVRHGRIIHVAHQPTLSDGTAGGIEPASVTFEMCRRLVDEWVLIDETEIASAMRRYMGAYTDRIEGSAALALAAIGHIDVTGNVAAIVCGGNVSSTTLAAVGAHF